MLSSAAGNRAALDCKLQSMLFLPVIACPTLVETVAHVVSGDRGAPVVLNVSGCSAAGSCTYPVSCLFRRCLRLLA